MTEDQDTSNEPSAAKTVKSPRKKTISEAALAADRANATKCTGPKTREGKFKSSLNAFKHVTYSHNFILKTEDAGTFENFSNSFIDEFQPATPSELELLKHLIAAAWHRNCIVELIQLLLNKAIDEALAATPGPVSAATVTQRAYDRLENTQPSFARQGAHELRLVNLFQRTLCRLNAIRDK